MLPFLCSGPAVDLVVYRLKTADWITCHHVEEGRGYVLKWQARGRQRALLLQGVINQYRLGEGRRAKRFHSVCRSKDFAAWDGELPSGLEQDFWRMCVEELQMSDEDSIASLAEVIASWQPQFWPPGAT